MATPTWIGNAIPVTQINTWTFTGTWEADDVITVTINTKTISMTTGSTVIATIATALQVVLADETDPDFFAIEWTANATGIIGTAKTTGVPFVCTFATTEVGGGAADGQLINSSTSSTGTATQIPTGPNWWTDVDNWDTGIVPVNADTVTFANSNVSCLFGLDQSAVTLVALHIQASFTGRIGLPRYVAQNGVTSSTTRYEYRDRYLSILCPLTQIGFGEGSGSAGINIDFLSTASAVRVAKTARPVGLESAVKLLGAGNNTVIVNGGSVGIAEESGDVMVCTSLKIAQAGASRASANVGSGATLTTVELNGGSLVSLVGATTLTTRSGLASLEVASAWTTINCNGGTVSYKSSGLVGTLNVLSGGVMNFADDVQARTVTTCNCYEGAFVDDRHGAVTFTNGVNGVNCTKEQFTLLRPANRKWVDTAL